MLSILSRLGTKYSVFFSIFHSKWDSFMDSKIPSLDSFFESLIKEQEKLIQMGAIKTSKDQALLVIDSTKAQDKGKSKGKEPKAADSKPKRIIRLLKELRALRRRKRRCVPIV